MVDISTKGNPSQTHTNIHTHTSVLINDNELQLQRQQQSVTEVHLSHKRKCTVFMSFTFYMNHPKETSRVSY